MPKMNRETEGGRQKIENRGRNRRTDEHRTSR